MAIDIYNDEIPFGYYRDCKYVNVAWGNIEYILYCSFLLHDEFEIEPWDLCVLVNKSNCSLDSEILELYNSSVTLFRLRRCEIEAKNKQIEIMKNKLSTDDFEQYLLSREKLSKESEMNILGNLSSEEVKINEINEEIKAYLKDDEFDKSKFKLLIQKRDKIIKNSNRKSALNSLLTKTEIELSIKSVLFETNIDSKTLFEMERRLKESKGYKFTPSLVNNLKVFQILLNYVRAFDNSRSSRKTSSFIDEWHCDICEGNQNTGCMYFDVSECPRMS